MALRLGALQDALLSAHADEDKARQAAEEIAGYETRFGSIDTKLMALQATLVILTAIVVGLVWLNISMKGDLAEIRAQTQAIARQLAPPPR